MKDKPFYLPETLIFIFFLSKDVLSVANNNIVKLASERSKMTL
jgi:hypothetical protein